MKVRIFDTTLRDGEQSPGVALSPENKLSIAKKLDELGVDAIETGFPVISQGEQQAVKMITEANLSAELCGLARTNKKDIDVVVEYLAHKNAIRDDEEYSGGSLFTP